MLIGKRDSLYSYERAILEAVVAAAPPSLAQTLRDQVGQIKHVQRSPASPEINFYASRRGGAWDQDRLLPNRGDIRLADVAARIRGQRHEGALYAVSGHLFSLVLRPEVAHPKGAVIDEIDVRLADVMRLTHPRAVGGVVPEVTPSSFHNSEVDAPDQDVGGWAVLKQDDVYLVTLPKADWAVLAQGPQGQLLLGRQAEAGECFCIVNVEDDVIQPLVASSWESALREAEAAASPGA